MKNKILLAICKRRDENPGLGFHYFLHPVELKTDVDRHCYQTIGNVIVEVERDRGLKMLECARTALLHQIELANLCDEFEKVKA